MTRLAPLLLPALAVAVVGCADHDPLLPATAEIVAVDALTLQPVTGVEVFLVDRDTGRIPAPPVAVDARGRAEVGGLVDADYAWFVGRGAGWTLAGLPPRAQLRRAGEPSPPVLPHLPLRAVAPGGLIRISGRVLDAATDAPIPQAVPGLPGWPDRWDGATLRPGDVSDADGAFLVHDVPFVEDPSGESPPRQLQPLVFQAEGYAPAAVRFDAPGFQFQEITDVTVRLAPLAAEATGAAAGRVVSARGPEAGVPVAAVWTGPGAKSGLAHPGLVAVTDAQGRFRLEGLAPGVWGLEPGYLPEDAWTPVRGQAGVVVVRAGETTEAPDLPVLDAVPAVFPRPGAQRVDSLPSFRWLAVAGADSYRVFLDRGIAGVTAETILALDPALALDEGNHLWWVAAETADGAVVGATDAVQLFRVGPFE